MSEPEPERGTDADAASRFADDPVMGCLEAEYGPVDLQEAMYDDEFERIVVSVINQSISTASANAVRERVYDALDDDITPANVLATDEAVLVDAGLGKQKTGYVRNIAEAFEERSYSRDTLGDHDDEAVVDLLTEIRGVGEWTARMYLLFALGREDVFPVGDLAVRRAIEELYGEMTRAEMVEFAERWAPYRSYATVLLWRWYEDDERAPLA
ncbi:DNA-3-methyladenine glycosylase family protein [Halomarina litorea]|uniref:DNA-3-methyladenine glycosylase family protein n=1 Tax=Halomarina litorea TaxID=2961595 RepID=UPI0020C1F7FC|nr:DNA-3-methyladenine glycosylase 2 family protein [Halomarina sp. BCD28]